MDLVALATNPEVFAGDLAIVQDEIAGGVSPDDVRLALLPQLELVAAPSTTRTFGPRGVRATPSGGGGRMLGSCPSTATTTLPI